MVTADLRRSRRNEGLSPELLSDNPVPPRDPLRTTSLFDILPTESSTPSSLTTQEFFDPMSSTPQNSPHSNISPDKPSPIPIPSPLHVETLLQQVTSMSSVITDLQIMISESPKDLRTSREENSHLRDELHRFFTQAPPVRTTKPNHPRCSS